MARQFCTEKEYISTLQAYTFHHLVINKIKIAKFSAISHMGCVEMISRTPVALSVQFDGARGIPTVLYQYNLCCYSL